MTLTNSLLEQAQQNVKLKDQRARLCCPGINQEQAEVKVPLLSKDFPPWHGGILLRIGKFYIRY